MSSTAEKTNEPITPFIYFAGQALASIIATTLTHEVGPKSGEISKLACDVAESMVSELERRGENK